MPKRRAGRDRVSYEEFERKHPKEMSALSEFLGWSRQRDAEPKTLADALGSPRSRLPKWAQELKHSPLIALLTTAGRENCPDAFNNVLYFGLRRLGVRVPEGVFIEPAGKPGRPESTALVYQTWIELGQPPLGGTKLAAAVYREAFRNGDAATRRRMIDRCRKTIGRSEARSGRNLGSI